ncbi:serine/threonine protein kinase [Actinopolyspora erythraea]|uniref:non-specific serine/threonine protein kinase n=1 Tax=Actinopolyspora erythraea TaxID=414996 RepID=A0A099D6T8_9ACTN|nr:Stk1 family PASTA domain-containing Ser/Thr kinase [Actinopolyspora erythraea]ASU79547.1 serine/threonine protein kinase [Actinopolyspora erythraea]KGI81065.1 protein kinase [Actinopolyspora erythraea]
MSSTTPENGTNDPLGHLLERRYRVDTVLARGGMSTVYRGLDTRLDRPVALKVMDSRYAGDQSFTERFDREARAAARLHHPNIVSVYDQGVDREVPGENRLYLVMRLVEGGTLRDLLRARGRLPLPVALTVLEAVLAALSAAHRAGMVHRDIKPENVLIGRDGSVQVADFGLVRAAAEAGSTSGDVILGTVAYLAPEQVTSGAADARSDVYAAGVVLYELLTGRPPYTGDTALSVAYRHVNDDVRPPSEQVPELSAAVDELVLRLTRRDPAGRPTDGAAALRELRDARDGLGLTAVPVPVPHPGDEEDEESHDPPTERISPVASTASTPNGATSAPGPQGTRALRRPAASPAPSSSETTNEIAPVPDEDESPSRGSRRGGRTLAVVGVVLLLGALVAGGSWLLGGNSYVRVPELAGKSVAEAEEALQARELEPDVSRSFHNTVPEDTVISSAPQEGTRMRSGGQVELRVSRGRPTVPEIEPGSRVSEAQSELRNAKLSPKLDSSANRYHESVPKGRVIGVDPAPGTEVRTSGTVTIIVSEGPRPEPVPDVGGLGREEAFSALEEAGFEPYEAGREFARDVAKDHVVRTSPSAGTEVPMSGEPRVGVVLSNAVSVPNLTGKTVEQARQQASRAGLTLRVNSVFGRDNGRVVRQDPSPGSAVKRGTQVRITVF